MANDNGGVKNAGAGWASDMAKEDMA